MRLLQPACSWFSLISPLWLGVAVKALTGMETRLSLRKPFQVERAAIEDSPKSDGLPGATGNELAGSWDAANQAKRKNDGIHLETGMQQNSREISILLARHVRRNRQARCNPVTRGFFASIAE